MRAHADIAILAWVPLRLSWQTFFSRITRPGHRRDRRRTRSRPQRRPHLRRRSDAGHPSPARRQHFRYIDPAGAPVRDAVTLERIRRLAIPPAYEDVWICPKPNGHLQATGRDARGRKQYRYHARWREVRDETKYRRMLAFGHALPRIRERLAHDIALAGFPREKVLATVVALLETTLIRVGNDEYAKENHSYGLTTMRNRHVAIDGSRLVFSFRGKSGVKHAVDVTDRRLARIVRDLRDMPGQELFHYVDHEGGTHRVESADVNAYLHEITGEPITAKDFRTWAGTIACGIALGALDDDGRAGERKRRLNEVIGDVAKRLGNTPAVCRKCYVHPAVIEHYLNEGEFPALRVRAAKARDGGDTGLRAEEQSILKFLEHSGGMCA